MKRIQRKERVSSEDAAKYDDIRRKVAEELPELLSRHHQRATNLEELDIVFAQLKAAREAQGLSLADITERTGMDRSALSKLETGQRANPTVETLVRYAEAVGKRLIVSLAETK
jgi:DNA-binding phage protein